MTNVIILIFAAVVCLLLSALFAGVETGVYQLSTLRLRLGVEKKQLRFVILDKTLEDRPAFLISILLGNNLVNYLLTGIVTYLLLGTLAAEHRAEFVATVITAPVLFVFAELIPKSIFFLRADALMPLAAPILLVFHKMFTWCGLVGMLKKLSHRLAQTWGISIPSRTAMAGSVQKHQIAAILRDGQQADILSPVQSEIISRLAVISGMRINDVMVPLSKIWMAEKSWGRQELSDVLRRCDFTRLPVYKGTQTNIVGFINVYECLCSEGDFANLDSFVRPLHTLPAKMPICEAIKVMQNNKNKIALVIRTGPRDSQRPVGIVTMKDLVEELLGELTEW